MPKLTTKVDVPPAGMFRPKQRDEDDAEYTALKKKHDTRFGQDKAGHRDARARAVKKMQKG